MKWIAIVVFGIAATAAAQERTFVFAGSKVEYEGKVVAGAPYTAQAVTETTQVLADGNRITHKSSSLIARDSQGRTRREQDLKTVGPWSTVENGSVVFINDPVAGARYNLQTNSKTAVKLPMNLESEAARKDLEKQLKAAARAKEEAERSAAASGVGVVSSDGGNVNITVSVAGGYDVHTNANESKSNAKAELLGTKTIEGVVTEGKRVTETIPAGKIGNQNPIEVINETWYSPELQTVVMSRHSDPRSGDVVYTLTNLSRAEPDPAMFTVPQDYKMREEGPQQRIELRRQP